MPKSSGKDLYIEGIGKVRLRRRKGQRNIRISIKPNYTLLSHPWYVNQKEALRFLEKRADWIAKNIVQDNQLIDGSHIGKSYTLSIEDDRKRSAIKGQIIHAPNNPELTRKVVLKALKQEAETLLSKRLDQLSADHNVSYKSYEVKHMRSKWGSCNSDKHIILNSLLVQLPWELIDYVILHELAHTSEMNHSSEFWNVVRSLCPDYKQLRSRLKQHHPVIYDTSTFY